MANKIKDLTGKRFVRLTVIGMSHRDKDRKWNWNCICDCGKKVTVVGTSLTKGQTKSCGCLRGESAKMFQANVPNNPNTRKLTRIARHQKLRCTDEKNPHFSNYGGRGIEWRFSSVKECAMYLSTLENNDSENFQCDRIDNNGHYEPGNIRFVSIIENANNKRNNVRHEVNGEFLSAREISDKYNLPVTLIRGRITRGYIGLDLIAPRKRRK